MIRGINANSGPDRRKHQLGEILTRNWRASVDANLPKLGEFFADPQLAQKICEGAKAEEARARPQVYFEVYVPPPVLGFWRADYQYDGLRGEMMTFC